MGNGGYHLEDGVVGRGVKRKAGQSAGLAWVIEGHHPPPELLNGASCISYWPFKTATCLVKCGGRVETQTV